MDAGSVMDVAARASRTAQLKAHVLSLGFDAVGFAAAERLDEEGVHLEDWLARGYQGSMQWLARNTDRRIDVREILPSARSVIVVARNYYTPHEHSNAADAAKISRYAWGRDYHKVLPRKLRLIEEHIRASEPGAETRSYVDTGPVLEKQWAVRAGIGWMGKHSNVITRDLGSWVFLGVIITSLELDCDNPIADYCGTCTLCIDACPTGAIVEPYVVDGSSCISYITIEQKPKLEIDAALGEQLKNWVFGCDICQDVCPWNRFEKPTDESDFAPRPGVALLTLDELASMTD
ncbi:MAG: tRNA epoxyqueuosine(34) reductase QueG, partial [bacterium]|nr:tRNA epoxyqueuosine(34) reductase QueG [Candidatus Kapabacteria bacterium]